MSSFADLGPDALARRLFILALMGVAAYITAVVLLNSSGDPKTEAAKPAVEIFAQAR
jgi:hypothetical protein